MGKGNVCVAGPYEGLFFIDNDYTNVYRREDDCEVTSLAADLSRNEMLGHEWILDDWGSAEELDDVLECFMDSFTHLYPSFVRAGHDQWIERNVRVILESNLFYLGVEDNEWSTAVKLIQKEDPYSDSMRGLQKQHYQRYLNGMKKALLERLPSIGTYTGPWTSGRITRNGEKEKMA